MTVGRIRSGDPLPKPGITDIMLEIRPITGADITRHIPELAKLRVEIFREWPYLYDGSADYESDYLKVYAESPGALIVLALEAGRIVGISTAVPLDHEPETVKAPLREAGHDPKTVLYAGESLLHREYRGRGVGVRFFDEREKHARSLGLRHVAFCRVIRDKADPRRPKDHVELDDYWHRRGYRFRPEIRTRFTWKEVGNPTPVTNDMEFFVKAL